MVLFALLDEYGRPRSRYSGTGELANENSTVAVEWAAAQYGDGQVLLACQGDPAPFDLLSLSGPTSFRGKNFEGTSFSCEKGIVEIHLLGDPPKGEAGAWAVYRLSMLQVDLSASGPPSLVRHLLTNFEFDRPVDGPLVLRLPGVEGEVRLVPDPADPHASKRLRALRSARPTAWLETQPQQGRAVAARTIANDICGLLSIARGTKVAWIREEVVNTEGIPTFLIHSNRVTKPFTPFAPIDPRRIGKTKEFLELTYPAFRDRRDRYGLDRGTIDSVLDAKTETDFLETRGAKLAVALETLKHNVLVADDPGVEYYMPPETFAASLEVISECVRSVLVDGGASKELSAAISGPQRLRSLNRRSFGSLLRQICREIGLRLDGSDLQLFINCRNSLVHRGDFYCQTASPAERKEVPPKATRFEEYLFLISVVDAFLLRLVDYSGPYLVRVGGSDWEEKYV